MYDCHYLTCRVCGRRNAVYFGECSISVVIYAQPSTCLQYDTHNLLWDIDIHIDHLISARRPDLNIINKEKREYGKSSTLLSRLTT